MHEAAVINLQNAFLYHLIVIRYFHLLNILSSRTSKHMRDKFLVENLQEEEPSLEKNSHGQEPLISLVGCEEKGLIEKSGFFAGGALGGWGAVGGILGGAFAQVATRKNDNVFEALMAQGDNSAMRGSLLDQIGNSIGNAFTQVGNFLDQQIGQRVANLFKFGTLQNNNELKTQLAQSLVNAQNADQFNEIIRNPMVQAMLTEDELADIYTLYGIKGHSITENALVAGPGATGGIRLNTGISDMLTLDVPITDNDQAAVLESLALGNFKDAKSLINELDKYGYDVTDLKALADKAINNQGEKYIDQLLALDDNGNAKTGFYEVTIDGIKFKVNKNNLFGSLGGKDGNTNINVAIAGLDAQTAYFMVSKAKEMGLSEVEFNSLYRVLGSPHSTGFGVDFASITKNGVTVNFDMTLNDLDLNSAQRSLRDSFFTNLQSDSRVTQVWDPIKRWSSNGYLNRDNLWQTYVETYGDGIMSAADSPGRGYANFNNYLNNNGGSRLGSDERIQMLFDVQHRHHTHVTVNSSWGW